MQQLLHDNVLLIEAVRNAKNSGIILPESAQKRNHVATVIGVPKESRYFDGSLKVGDKVLFIKEDARLALMVDEDNTHLKEYINKEIFIIPFLKILTVI